MTKHRTLAALASAALAAVFWLSGTAVANAAGTAAIDPPDPVFRDLAVSATSLSIDRTWFQGTATISITKVGQLQNPGDLRIEFRIGSADDVWLDDQQCSYFFVTGKYTCTIPNSRLPRNIIPARFSLWVQSHQLQFVPRNETYGVEIFPGDADLTDDHTTARVFR